MADIKKLLELKKAMHKKRPRFVRQDWHKKRRLAAVWRKPKGIDSKLRKHMHGHGHLPSTGYQSPALVRGLHKSGLLPVLVRTQGQLDGLDGRRHGIIIASGVGDRNRIDIITKAQTKSIRVLNFKDPAKKMQSIKDALAKRKAEKKASKPAPATAKQPAATKPEAKEAPASQEEKKETERREAEKVLTKKE